MKIGRNLAFIYPLLALYSLKSSELTISPTAYMALNYFKFSESEIVGCLFGTEDNNAYHIMTILPDYSAKSKRTSVIPTKPCPSTAMGRIHNHAEGEGCWYKFPETSVETSDGVSFRLGGYSIDIIVCKDKLVWIDKTGIEREMLL